MKEIENLPIPDDPDLKNMLEHFLTLVNKCEDVVMLSDGTNIEIEFIFDAKGCVGELCWQNEVPLLNKYLEKYGGDLLKELANKGTVKKTPELMKELGALPSQEEEADQCIQYRVDRLIALVKKCKKVITITKGFDDDVEGPQILFVP